MKKRNFRKTAAVAFALSLGAVVAQAQTAQDKTKERVDNVIAAAQLLGKTEIEKGMLGAFTEMRKCYEREMPLSYLLTRQLEQCVAQDMIISRVIANASSVMTPEQRAANSLPDPQVSIQVMTERIIDVFQRMQVPQDDAKELTETVRTHGMQAYGKTRYPDKVK